MSCLDTNNNRTKWHQIKSFLPQRFPPKVFVTMVQSSLAQWDKEEMQKSDVFFNLVFFSQNNSFVPARHFLMIIIWLGLVQPLNSEYQDSILMHKAKNQQRQLTHLRFIFSHINRNEDHFVQNACDTTAPWWHQRLIFTLPIHLAMDLLLSLMAF